MCHSRIFRNPAHSKVAMHRTLAAFLLLTLAACVSAPVVRSPGDVFFENLSALCGQSFEGRLVEGNPTDDTFSKSRLVMHVRDCSASEIRIPFAVGEDRSRTWVITRTEDGLRFKHDHRHEDGSEDVRSNYGGDARGPGTAIRQEFPADAFSRELFVREEIPQAVENVWALEVKSGSAFAYELSRPGRHFRVVFDLTKPVTP